jgi:hypothetical protein
MKLPWRTRVDVVSTLSRALRDRGMAPRRVEVCPFEDFHVGVVADSEAGGVIHTEASTGVAEEADVAVAVALTEYVERTAFWSGAGKGLALCDTERSDGFAAFPVVGVPRSLAAAKARRNAYLEAVERFTWATWWDDAGVAFDTLPAAEAGFTPFARSMLAAATAAAGLAQIEVILPRMEDPRLETVIVVGHRAGGGVVSGGAAGERAERRRTIERGLSELLRHALAIARLGGRSPEEGDLYNARLAFFADQEGGVVARRRLAAGGHRAVCLPHARHDGEVAHDLQDVVVVHRFLFEGQPAFVGGPVGRFCL